MEDKEKELEDAKEEVDKLIDEVKPCSSISSQTAIVLEMLLNTFHRKLLINIKPYVYSG